MPLLISVSVGLALLRTEGGKQTFVTQTLATHLAVKWRTSPWMHSFNQKPDGTAGPMQRKTEQELVLHLPAAISPRVKDTHSVKRNWKDDSAPDTAV